MNHRLQKKCFIASAGFHLTLAVILLIGPGFLSSKSKPDDSQILDIIPSMAIEQNAFGGGDPHGSTAPPPPPPSRREEVQPPPPTRHEEHVEPVKTPQRDPDAFDTKPQKKSPTVNLVEKKRPTNKTPNKTATKTPTTSTDDSRNDSEERERQALANSLKGMARSIRQGVSGTTSVEFGPGGGGPVYAGYKQIVGSVYYQAWREPDDAANSDATVVASVTIAHDGNVLSGRITKPSGNNAIDRSVQATLDRVRFVAPFPEGAKEEKRDFTINFNAKAKQIAG